MKYRLMAPFASIYPLYDVPYLVRDPNEFRMSAQRHELEVRNQAVVDDYFILRDRGLAAHKARKQVANKHKLTQRRVFSIIKWFFNQARIRRKYDFLEKFFTSEIH